MDFRSKLERAWEQSGSLLCIGLDPDPAQMAIDDVAAFNIAIIEATSDLVCAYKPNLGFYLAYGLPGMDALLAQKVPLARQPIGPARADKPVDFCRGIAEQAEANLRELLAAQL